MGLKTEGRELLEIHKSFIHGGTRYYAGELRSCSAEEAGLFRSCGWACRPGEELTGSTSKHVDLNIHNAVLGTTSEQA